MNLSIDRRTFLKTTGSLAFAAALIPSIKGPRMLETTSEAVPAKYTTAEWKNSYCSSCIWPNCATQVLVQDGVATTLQGNPAGPFNQGTLCPRGQAQIQNLYNPYRVKAPMKRTNPSRDLTADPKWVEITWDEALNTIADRLKKIRATDGRTFATKFGFSSQLHESVAPIVMATSVGSPNAIMTAGPLCTVHYSPMLHHGTYVDKIDLSNCKYVINFGKTLGSNFAMASGPTRALADAIDRGMKLVVVDPRSGPESSKGEWIPIRPATDLAFGLAMLNVILIELGKFDVGAAKKRTNGPFLVGADGYYVRDADSKKPLVWDPLDKQAKVFDDKGIKDFALEGTFTVNNATVRPAFDLLKQHVKQYTPEWAEKITTVPAGTIRRLTQEFVEAANLGSTIKIDNFEFPYRPVALTAERGSVGHIGGRWFHYVTGIINALMGAADVPGAVCSLDCGPQWLQNGPDGTIEAPGSLAHYYHGKPWKFPPDDLEVKAFYPISLGQPHVTARAIMDPQKYNIPYKLEAMMIHGENALMHNANPAEVAESYKHIPFLFAISYHFDEPTSLADIVLPESSNMERNQIYLGHPLQSGGTDTIGMTITNFKSPVVAPVYNSKQAEDIIMDIAERGGFLGGPGGMNFLWNAMLAIPKEKALALDKRYSWREICDIRLKAMYGDDKGIDYFIQNGFIAKKLPLAQTYNYYYHPEARVEIYGYSQFDVGKRLKANLDKSNIKVPGWNMDDYMFYFKALPEWKDTFLFTAAKEFDLFVINWKISPRNIGIGSQDDNPWLREVVELWDSTGLRLLMNASTAAAKGLKDGDRVAIDSQHGGNVEGIVQTSQLIHPEVIGVAGQGGHMSTGLNPITQRGIHYNKLLNSTEGYFCPSSGGIDTAARVRIRKL